MSSTKKSRANVYSITPSEQLYSAAPIVLFDAERGVYRRIPPAASAPSAFHEPGPYEIETRNVPAQRWSMCFHNACLPLESFVEGGTHLCLYPRPEGTPP